MSRRFAHLLLSPRAWPAPLVAACLAVCLASPARAHHPALSALTVHILPERVDLFFDLDALAVGERLKLDRDGNNVVDAREFEQGQAQVLAYMDERFSIQTDRGPCAPAEVERYLTTPRLDKLQLLRPYTCPAGATRLVFRQAMLTEMSGGHSHVARIQLGREISGHVFMRGAEELTIELGAPLHRGVASPARPRPPRRRAGGGCSGPSWGRGWSTSSWA